MNLKDILGDELFQQVSAKIDAVNAAEPDKAKHAKFVDLSEGQYVSRGKYDTDTGKLNQQITGLQEQITKRDTDLAGLQQQLTAAQQDAGKLTEAQTALTNLQTQYNNARTEWDQKMAQQAYEYAVRAKANELKFSSAAAKKDFIREAIAAGMKMDGDTLLGYTDFLNKYKESDPGALVDETTPPTPPTGTPAPTIVLPANPATPAHKMTLSEMMKAKNENPNMEIKFE